MLTQRAVKGACQRERNPAPMGAFKWKVKRERLRMSVYLLMRLNGWIDELVGGRMSDGE